MITSAEIVSALEGFRSELSCCKPFVGLFSEFPETCSCKRLYIATDEGEDGGIYVCNNENYERVSGLSVIQFVDPFPTPLIEGRIYISSANGEIRIFNGTDTFVYLPDDIPNIVTVRVQGTTFLSGGYFNDISTGIYKGSGIMNTTLSGATLLPAQEPYTKLGYHVSETITNASNFTNIVDWILIELRDKNDPKIIKYSKSCLLRNDGIWVDSSDNAAGIIFENIIEDDYYVAVKHRNHFGVMSAVVQPLATIADFGNTAYSLWEQDDTYYTFNIDGYRLLTSGKYMVAGFTAISGSYSPYTEVYRGYQAFAFGYLLADFNLDGSIDLIEHSFWEGFKNNMSGTGLEDNKAVDNGYDADGNNNEGIIVERIPDLHKGWLKQILNNDAFGGFQIPLYNGEPLYVWSEGSMIYRTDNSKLMISSGGLWKEVTLI